jgi:topoisomerase-4 subunit B
MATDTRRLVRLTLDDPAGTRRKQSTDEILDMLLAKKRAPDRKNWLEESGNLADYAE